MRVAARGAAEFVHAVLRLVAHELPARWRSWAVLVLLVAVAGGAVLTAAAGARRTDSAYPRFLRASKASDVLLSSPGTGLGGYYDAIGRLPEVAALAPLAGLNVQPLGPGGRPSMAAAVGAPPDGRFGHLLEIPKVVAGRLPLPDRPGEVAVDQNGAATLHLRVGGTLTLEAIPSGRLPGASAAPVRPRRLHERVVGIIATRGTITPVNDLDKLPFILASTALFRQLGPAYIAFDGAYVKLRPGATPESFGGQAQSLARRFPGTGGRVFVAEESNQAAAIERSIRPQAVALALFALVLAVTGLLIVGQAAARVLVAASSDNPALSALGMTRGQLTTAGLIEVGAAVAIGAVAATGVAIAASPLMPIGPARLAEPDPGVSVDAAVLAVGAAAIVVLLVARAAWPAWHLAATSGAGVRDAAEAPGRRSLFAHWLAATGAPVTAATGIRLALEPGRGRTAVPAWSALAGATLSVMAVAAAFTFGANLLHLVHAPRLYGQNWDAAIDPQFQPVPRLQADHLLRSAPGVLGWSFGLHGIIGINGVVAPAIGLTAGRGPLLSPTLLEGHPPRTSDQIVLGTSLLQQLGRHVGQVVMVTADGHHQLDRIVGRAVFPNFGQGSFTPTDLGQGAELTASALEPQAVSRAGTPNFDFVLLRFAPGPRRETDIASFARSVAGLCHSLQQATCVVTDQRPNGVADYARIDGTPEVLAVMLAGLGLAVLGQFIVLSGRRRRRDFAILKTLGLLRRQVSAVTAWQVTTLTGLALLAGLPLGVAAGHWAWALFADSLGLSPGAITPVSLLLVIVPAVIVAGNAIAFWAGRAAARLSPAEILRTE
jgi:hypothetical protein